MTDLIETRRRKLIEFVDGFANDWKASEKLGIHPGYLSQLKMGPSGEKKTGRAIGEKIARKMEMAATLTHLWFDGINTQLYKLSKKEIAAITKSRVATQARKKAKQSKATV